MLILHSIRTYFKAIPVKIFLLLLSFIISINNIRSNAQTLNNKDIELIRQQVFFNPDYEKKPVKFLLSKRKNPLIRYNPVVLSFGSLMFFYQKVLSQQFSANCIYEIGCSNFSKKIIWEYGLVKGLALSADRLMRCTEYTIRDFDINDFNSDHKLIDNPEKYRLKN